MKGLWRPYLFILPALVPLVLFTYLPLWRTLQLSFFDWNMISPDRKWAGLTNYRSLFESREFWMASWNTVKYTALLLLLNLAGPLLVAHGVTRVGRRWQAFYKGVIFAPAVVSLAVASVIFLWIFNPLVGAANALLGALGLPAPNWLSDYTWVIWALAAITAWKSFGYNFIVLLAGLLSVPKELEEAARVDGSSGFQITRRVILPLTSSTILYVLVSTVVLGSQYVFVPIEMLTGGGPNQASTNLVHLIYQFAFSFFKTGYAAAASVVTFLGFLALIFLQARVMERRVYYEN